MGARPGETKFLTTSIMLGFGAMAFALYRQRVILNRYGYDLVLTGIEIGHENIHTLINAKGEAINPANTDAVKLATMLKEWREGGQKTDHLHMDTGRDNRILILKNKVHIAAAPPLPEVNTEHYYMYAQGRNGNYVLHKIDHPENILQGMDYLNGPFNKDAFTYIKRDIKLTESLLNPANNGGNLIEGEKRIDPRVLEQWKKDQGKGLMLFGALALAAKGPTLAQQVFGNASYAIMNSVGSTVREGKGISGAVNKMLKPLRTKLDF